MLVAACLAAASVAQAHHISGTLYCDTDFDGAIDVGTDGRLNAITVRAVSQDVNPGETFTDASDGSGFYNIGLPARTDRYLVTPIGLPGTWTIVIPAGGSHLIQIITGGSQDHADGVDFLVQGCAAPPNTTSSTTTSSTSTVQPTTSSTSTSTTSSTAAPTTTTLVGVCDCTKAFFTNRSAKYNNDATINANAVVNSPLGQLKLGRNVVMPDGTSLTANFVQVGNASSVYDVFANTVKKGFEAVVRHDEVGPITLPISAPFCESPSFECGGAPITVPPAETQTLTPGTYGVIRVMNGATLQLAAGVYTVCDVKMGRQARIEAHGAVTFRVVGNLRIGTASYFGPVDGAPLIDTYVGGRKVRTSQSALTVARVVAPLAQLAFGRDSALTGCFCADRAKSDKHITLNCLVQ
jgi:hypothetical protein